MKNLIYFFVAITVAVGITSCSNKEEGPQKWEYKTLAVNGNDFGEFYAKNFPVPVRKLDTLGSQGWELVDVYTQIETVHPNFGNAQYVTGLQPNTRTCLILYVFKRPLRDGAKKDEKEHFEVVSTDELTEVVEATTDSIAN